MNNKKEKGNAGNKIMPDTLNRATFTADKDINTDPLGMWTGVPTDDPYDMPVQDADDL